MSQLDRLATLRQAQRAPEAMHTAGRHLPQILDMLSPAQFDLEEGRVVVNPQTLEFPEHDGRVFRRELLVPAVIVQRAAQDWVILGSGKPLERLDAALKLHLPG